jgi:hypothetical protein
LGDQLRSNVLELVRDKYAGFGPTLISEKLEEREGLQISKETIRGWMIEDGLWVPKCKASERPHPLRMPRANYGALVQIDGSPHHWFGPEQSPCTLIVFVDDATSRLQALQFFPAEKTHAYFEMMQRYISKYGMPQALYSDQHSIFKINRKNMLDEGRLTQFGRATEALGIELIHAHSPQAKGRVERKNRVLQDRLVKELRLDKIESMEMANGAFLDQFIEAHNKKFSKCAMSEHDLHVFPDNPEEVNLHLTVQNPRRVSKNLSINYSGKTYCLKKPDKKRRLYQAQVIVCEDYTGKVSILYKGQSLEYEVYNTGSSCKRKTLTRKEVDAQLNAQSFKKSRTCTVPAADHPWRKYSTAS